MEHFRISSNRTMGLQHFWSPCTLWKLRKSLSLIVIKNFVKLAVLPVLLNLRYKSWFDEFFLVRKNFSFFHTVPCTRILLRFSLTQFWQKIRESNVFTKEINRVDLTKFLFSEREFLVFPHCRESRMQRGKTNNLLQQSKKYFVKSTI